jgi:hypothetical protein
MYGTPTKTVGDVFTAVQRQFGDESGTQLVLADVIRWVNDGQQEIVKQNRILKAKGTANSVAGQQSLDVSGLSIFQIESLHYDGQLVPNVSFAQAEQQVSTSDVTQDQGSMPTFWYEFAGQILFYPIPSAAKPVTVYYTVAPPVYPSNVALTQLLFVPDRYFSPLVKFVMQMAYEMDEDWEASQAKEKQFTTDLDNFGEEDRTSQNMSYSTITVID